MKILMVTSARIPPEEGIGTYVFNLSKNLVSIGHEVTILTRGGKRFCRIYNLEGIKVIESMFIPLYPFHVHVHSLTSSFILRNSDFDVIHYHTPLPPVLNIDLPSILTVHTPMKADSRHVELINITAVAVKLQALISIGIEKGLIKKNKIISVVASSVARELNDYGINENSVMVLGNGVDTEYFVKGDESQSQYLLYVGRLGFRKGIFDLLKAMKLLKQENINIRLLMVGKGPLEAEIRNHINILGLEDTVILIGHISQNEKNRLLKLYQGATIFIQPSHYEGLPTTLLEAMSCGCAIISTAVSGSLDVVQNRVNGILIPPKSPIDIKESVKYMLSNPDLRYSLGQEARNTAVSNYSWKKITMNYLNLYREATY